MRILVAYDGCVVAHGLIINEDAVLDYVPLHSLHAVVIPAARCESVLLNLVALDVDELRAVLKFAELLARGEGRARVVGFQSKHAVKLCRVAYGFVNREPEIRWMKNEVFASRLNWLRRVFLNRLLCGARDFADEVVLRNDFVAFAYWRTQTRTLLKSSCLRVNRCHYEIRPRANQGLLYA